MFPDALQPGSRIGQATVQSVLGQGGFGIVYQADHPQYGIVAIKEFFPNSIASRVADGRILSKSPKMDDAFAKGLRRLLDEGQKLKSMNHPGVVRVFEVEEANGTGYIVMERINGRTLLDVAENDPDRFSISKITDVAEKLADALAYVHSEGLIHRDVAPDNVLLDYDQPGRVVLIDFGGAKRIIVDATRSSTMSLAKTGYSPVESYSRDEALKVKPGPWTDVYGAAATLYRLVVGETPMESVARLENDRMTPASVAARGKFPKRFLDGIDWGLSVRPERRPQNVAQWRAVLEGKRGRPQPGRARSLVLASLAFALVGSGFAVGYMYFEQPQLLEHVGLLPEGTATWRAVDKTDPSAIRTFLASHSHSTYAAEAIDSYVMLDEAAWSVVAKSSALLDYIEYVETFPATGAMPGRHSEEAAVKVRAGVSDLQEKLSKLGMYLGAADGVMAAETGAALRAFQNSKGLDETGQPNQATLIALEQASRLTTSAASQPAVSTSPLNSTVPTSSCRTESETRQVCRPVTRYRPAQRPVTARVRVQESDTYEETNTRASRYDEHESCMRLGKAYGTQPLREQCEAARDGREILDSDDVSVSCSCRYVGERAGGRTEVFSCTWTASAVCEQTQVQTYQEEYVEEDCQPVTTTKEICN
jgi:serine/threonine protein kinase